MSHLPTFSPPAGLAPGLRRALIAIAIAGVVTSAVPLAMAIHSVGGHHRDLIAVFGPIIGGAFIGTGLLAWMRRPQNRFGALMVAIGFSYCLSGLVVSTDPWPFVAGALLLPLPYAILVHLLLAFPSGRLATGAERALVVAMYVTSTVAYWSIWPFQNTLRQGLPENPLLVSDRPDLVRTMADLRFGVVIVLLLTLGWFLARRWRAASRAQRRSLVPVLLSGGLVLGLYAVWAAAGIAGLPNGLQENLERARVVALATVPFAFLLGLLRSKVAGAAAVGELVSTLGEQTQRRGGLQDALADALGDPSLELIFPVGERGEWVDGSGSPVALAPEVAEHRVTPIERDGRPIAAIVHDASLAEQRDLVRTAGAALALALENERLDAELRANVQELRASRARIVQSGDAARRRIERDLHDGAQQQLVAILLALRVTRARIERDPAEAAEMLDTALGDLEGAIAELRELARGIHPAILSDRGLGPALEALAGRLPLPVDIAGDLAERPPPNIEAAAYYVAAEALTNVARYAQASHARIEVGRDGERIVLQVTDDGVGGADPANGSGLRGLSDRVAALDGRLEVDSPPAAGTTIRAIFPCPPEQPARPGRPMPRVTIGPTGSR